MFFRLLLSVNIFFSTIVFANNIDTALELTKEGVVSVSQKKNFQDIMIKKVQNEK